MMPRHQWFSISFWWGRHEKCKNKTNIDKSCNKTKSTGRSSSRPTKKKKDFALKGRLFPLHHKKVNDCAILFIKILPTVYVLYISPKTTPSPPTLKKNLFPPDVISQYLLMHLFSFIFNSFVYDIFWLFISIFPLFFLFLPVCFLFLSFLFSFPLSFFFYHVLPFMFLIFPHLDFFSPEFNLLIFHFVR